MFDYFIAIWKKVPAKIRGPVSNACRWKYFGICCLVLVTLILHFSIICQVDSFVFDEVHYISEGRLVIAGEEAMLFEHPPLARLFIITGIRLFGDSPFGWRFFSVIFATISVVLFYFICRRLEMPRGGPFLATLVFALENLSFIMGSIAMLDVYMVTFMLGAFLLFLQRRPVTSGLSIALSALAKTTGVFTAITLSIDWLLDRQRKWVSLITLAGSAFVSFAILFTGLHFTLLGRLDNPVKMINNMVLENTSITFTENFQLGASKPWDWLLQPMSIFGSFNPQYILILSLTVWVVIFPVLAYLIWEYIKGSKTGRFGIAWFAGTYLPVVFMVLLTDRVTFIYYFYPVVGAICLGIGLGLAKLLAYWRAHQQSRRGQSALIGMASYLFLHVVTFILFSPIGVSLIKWLPL
ncbi:MAG: glycosyltransferase family 39 protein [Dehalococcoidales bacterium]|nr:glycosyltransferase family 39 protein [Dehalococcoidales bacterium]